VAISNSLILLHKIAALRLWPWMACMQKMQEHFSVAMTAIYVLIRGSLDVKFFAVKVDQTYREQKQGI